MKAEKPSQITQNVNELAAGDHAAAARLFSLLYGEFRKLARRYLATERPGHTLDPTALVHEAYMKLVDQTHVVWLGKQHFFAAGAHIMRRILVDHARRKRRVKRGGGRHRIALDEHVAVSPERDEDVLAVDDAMVKLAEEDALKATIVELRFFGGLSVAEVAKVLGVPKRTVERKWTMARAWLRRELHEDRTQ